MDSIAKAFGKGTSKQVAKPAAPSKHAFVKKKSFITELRVN